MKTLKQIFIVLFCSLAIHSFSQKNSIPETELFTLDGIKISSDEIINSQKPMLMVFWKTNVNECCEQLNMLNEIYTEKYKEKGVKVVAICVDCKGAIQHIKPFIHGHDFDIDVFIDKNGDFKRKMNVPTVPYTILFDQSLAVYCKYIGYCHDGEEMICSKIDHCLANLDK